LPDIVSIYYRRTGKPNPKITDMKISSFFIVIVLIFTQITLSGQETGKASFYSKKLHGHRTADGSKYHNDSLTCAHRTLPLGTLIKVKNVSNNKEVIVKVTDRGPFHRNRVIDLSYKAAKELGLIQSGVGTVEISKYVKILQQIPTLIPTPISLLNIMPNYVKPKPANPKNQDKEKKNN